MSEPTNEDWAVIKKMRAMGYAICIFSPDELRGADTDGVEEQLVQAGWDAIDSLAKYSEDDE